MKYWWAWLLCAVAMFFAGRAVADTLLVTLSNLPQLVQSAGNHTNSGTTVGVTFTSAPNAGDYIICEVSAGANNAVITPPAGFSLIAGDPTLTDGALTRGIYARFATSTSPAGPYTWGSNSTTGLAAACKEFANVDTTTPIAGVATSYALSVPSGSQTFMTASITPTISGTQPLSFFAIGGETQLTVSPRYYNDGLGTQSTSGSSTPVSVSVFRSQFASTNTTTPQNSSATGTLSAAAPSITDLILLNHGGGMVTPPIVYITPTPLPSPTPGMVAHYNIYTDVNGCYHNAHRNSGGSCYGDPAPTPLAGPTASDSQVQSDITTMGKYVNFWQDDNRTMVFGLAAGMQMGFYNDFNYLHPNSGTITATTYPDSIIAHDTSGNQVFLPNENPSVGGSFLADPTATGNPTLLNYANGVISQQVNAQYGPFKYNWNRNDDENYPGAAASYYSQLACAGFFNNNKTTGPCPASNPQLNGTTQPFLAFPPYNSSWVAGTKNLFANESLPVIWNDFTDPTYAVLLTTNTLGVQCETCVTDQNETTWVNHINSAIVANENGINMIYFRAQYNNLAQEQFFWASLSLVADHPGLLGAQMQPNSPAVNTNSGIPISPLYYIIPTQPLTLAPTFDPIAINYSATSPPTNVGVGTLKTSTGAYAREWGACYANKAYLGPCAAVVNPTNASVAFPTLSRTYTHTATYSGYGVITEFGDNGVLVTNGAAPPATMAAGTGYMVFP